MNDSSVLVKEITHSAPVELSAIPLGIEAGFGVQQQARGFVLPLAMTNRFLPPSGAGFGDLNGWYFGFVHYRIPRERNRVRLLVNTVKGGVLRVTKADPVIKIGYSKSTLTTVLESNTGGVVDYQFSPLRPDFNYSAQSFASP